MNTINDEALAKVASISDALESFAKSISMQKINIHPITMIGEFDWVCREEKDETSYHDDTLNHEDICLGCMDCLGLSWRDFL